MSGMRVSLVGALRNGASALEVFNTMLGGDEAEGENADIQYAEQPSMCAYVLGEIAGHVEQVTKSPALIDEFMTLYCMKERDAVGPAEALFAASWERMVLLACSLEYRPAYGVPMPIGDVDHYIPALEGALACVGAHQDARPKQAEGK